MAGDSSGNAEPIAQLQEKEPTQQQIVRRGRRRREIRRDIVWVLGIIATLLLGALRPEMDHPHDFWAASVGADFLFAAIGLYLYDSIRSEFAGTIGVVVLALMVISAATADQWTRDFRLAQDTRASANVSPQISIAAQEATPLQDSEPFHVTLGASLVTPPVPNSITPFSVIYNDVSISPVNLTLFATVENNQSASGVIKAYGLEAAPNIGGPWVQLCPVSLIGGQVWWLADPSKAILFDFSNGLEPQLLDHEINGHGTVSGWTLWECPSSDCGLNAFRFSIEDAAGQRAIQIIPKKSFGRELRLDSSFLKPLRFANPPDLSSLKYWNQCK